MKISLIYSGSALTIAATTAKDSEAGFFETGNS